MKAVKNWTFRNAANVEAIASIIGVVVVVLNLYRLMIKIMGSEGKVPKGSASSTFLCTRSDDIGTASRSNLAKSSTLPCTSIINDPE